MKPQPIKNQYLNGKMLDRNKCSFYQKTSGKCHKLCLGQSKASRHWKVNNGFGTNSNQNENCVNTTNSLPDPTLIFPLEEEETPKFSGNRFHKTVSISSAQLDSKSILSTLPNEKHFLSTNIHQSVKIVCRQSSETGSNKQENTIDPPPEKKNVKRNKRQSRREQILRKLTDTKMLHSLIKKLDECRGITRIHRSPSRPRPSVRPTAKVINIHEHPI